AMLSETDDDGRPVAYNRVAGVVVTGNEDGAHHVISEITGGLQDIGYTIPGQAWTYWNQGPGPGPSFLEAGPGHDWARSPGGAMAASPPAVARATQERPRGLPPQWRAGAPRDPPRPRCAASSRLRRSAASASRRTSPAAVRGSVPLPPRGAAELRLRR